MKRVFASILCISVLSVLWSGNLKAEIKVTPVANVSLLGGQYWVTGSAPANFAGNVNLFVSPVLNFSPKLALLPIYTLNYSGTKDVRELVGGGTLTRQMQDHYIALKLVSKMSQNLKLKARVGYKIEYLVETTDESWGSGLFDFNKLIVGAELERLWAKVNAKIGVDYYTMTYPNYLSLITNDSFETSLDTTTYSEVSTQAGTNVLDYKTINVYLEAVKKFASNVSGKAHYDISVKSFNDQKIVETTGEFSSSLRSDMVHYLSLSVNLESSKLIFGLSENVQYYDSNQNSYDAANSKYTANYYDFIENSMSPSLLFLLGKQSNPVKFYLYQEVSWRGYMERLTQNSDGDYQDKKVSQNVNTTGINFTYPITKSLSGRFAANYRDSTSNMRYEKNYKYNYYTFNYFAGVNWRY